MSGPKVVRIITREELEALGRGQLQAVDDAIRELEDRAKRHGALDEGLARSLAQRREALARLFEQGRWTMLQQQAAQDVAFLKAEADRIRAQAIAAAAAARERRRRTGDAARTLLSAFEAAARTPPQNLRDVASGALTADEPTLAAMQSVLNEAFQQLKPGGEEPSTAQRELAERLGAGEVGRSFAGWLSSRPGATGGQDGRLDALLAELEALEEAEVARPFVERAAAVAAEPSASRRALLLDSLVLDVAAHCQAWREREAHAARQAREWLEAEQKELAAAARRRAVLGGLAALGYEVRETMATAWAKDGRIVVRKPGAGDYGVELGAPGDAARMQVRLVGSDRPSAPRDARRDRDMEQGWCTDFQRLSELLAGSGAELVVERALEVGAQPVKTVPLEPAETDERDIKRVPAARRQP